jgi:tRNA threonylcarbamoyladenosine biosynthesis protein TsaB
LKILGIETSTLRCEIALSLDDQAVASAQLPAGSRPTATLPLTIRDLCRSVGWSPRELNLVCVDQGPGSYTGLRVGITCAKTLAFAAGAAMATADSLEVVANNAPPTEQFVEVGFDAARGQVFACRFRRDADAWTAQDEVRIVSAEDWASHFDPSAVIIGPALEKYRGLVSASLRVGDETDWWPRAERVIQLGLRQFRTAPLREYFTLEPAYLRPSAAEEKRTANRE